MSFCEFGQLCKHFFLSQLENVGTEVPGEAANGTTQTDLVKLGVGYITILSEDRGYHLLLLTWRHIIHTIY